MSDAKARSSRSAKKAKAASAAKTADAVVAAAIEERARDPNYVPRFKKRYNEVVRPELMKKFGYKNALQVPQASKGRAEHRRGRGGGATSKKIQAGAERSDRDCRPEGAC